MYFNIPMSLETLTCSQGTCVLSKCECFDGFWGESCDQLKCPGDVCEYDYKNRRQVCHQCCGGQSPCVENRGYCNGKTATCQCGLGFEGENCNVLKCPTHETVNSFGVLAPFLLALFDAVSNRKMCYFARKQCDE